MKLAQRLGVAIMAAVLLAALGAAAVLGYSGQVSCQVLVLIPSGAIAPGATVTVSATVRDTNGNPVVNVPVSWSLSGAQPGDSISPTTSTTNASGEATATVALSTAAGSRTVRAQTSQDSVCSAAVGGGVMGVRQHLHQGDGVLGVVGGLPNTSTASGPAGISAWELAIVALVALGGLALGTRRFLVRR